MKTCLIAIWLLAAYALPSLAAETPTHVPSQLTSATIYRNAAEMNHTARVQLRKGSSSILLEDLSNNVDINSIQIHCSDPVTILSVEFSKQFLKPESRTALEKKLMDTLETANHQLARLEVQLRADNELLTLLRANKEIRGTQSGLSVTELMKMMEYFKQQTLELENDLLALREKETILQENINKLRNELSEAEQKNTRTSGSLTLQILSAAAVTAEFTISYITPTAGWIPSYDIRADNINKPLKLLYKAKITQATGLDWKQVRLSLSSAQPREQGNAPVLRTWFLKYSDPWSDLADSVLDKRASIRGALSGKLSGAQLDEVVVTALGVKRGGHLSEEPQEPIYIVNGKTMSAEQFNDIDQRAIKNIRVLKDREATALYGTAAAAGAVVVTLREELDDYVAVSDNQLNVTFDIDVPFDMASNGKEQQIILKQYDMPAGFIYYAAPKLSPDAFLLGEVTDWGKFNLLPGEASIIFEGTFVGRTLINPASTMDTLNLTLGRDKRVVVNREKISDFSSVKFLGSNKKQVFSYELTVKNNKKDAVVMVLKDQYPISSSKEIEAELLESTGASVNKETGLLTWKLQIQPGEIRKLRISYSVKYPKDRTLRLP